MDKLYELAVKTQTVCGTINFLSSFIAWPTIIYYLKDFLDQDRFTFNCYPKPSDFVKQLCYEDYTSTVSPLAEPLYFAGVTFSSVGFCWLAFISYGVRALWRIKKEQDSEREKSMVKWLTVLYLVQVCIRLAVLIVMMIVFCRFQTLGFPEMYLCSRGNSRKILTNQIKNITCNDMHRRQKSMLNIGIIALVAISIILCVVTITHLLCTWDHFLEQLLEDPEHEDARDSAREDTRLLNAEDTPENNHGSFDVSPGENFEMLHVEEWSFVEKCQEQLKYRYATFSKVKTVPWDDSSSIHIDEIYTPLYWVRDERTPSGVTQEELEDYTDMFKGNKHLRKPTRMLVYGRPGIGKSTFCKRAAYDWSKAFKEILKNFYVLLLIKLRDVCDLENIRDVLRASKLLAGDGLISVDSLYDYIINNEDKVLLILDGYDEYRCAKEHSPILEIWEGELLRDCHVIVTTRQMKCDELRVPSHVQFEILGFKTLHQIKTFASKFLTIKQDVEEFMSYLKEKDLADMAEIPLLLLILCLLWKEKRHEGLPTARADIYMQFIQTMLDHRDESQQPIPFQKVTSTEATEDLSSLGKVAFDALLQDRLYVLCNELPGSISRTFEKLSDVGLFQIVNMSSPNREKGAYFIHKSVQEFLAACYIKEEVLAKGDSTPSLSKVESFVKIVKISEVLKFASELSTEAACTVFHHLKSVGGKNPLSEFKFREPLQSTIDLSEDQQQYLKLISQSCFCCSTEKLQGFLSTLLSLTGGILLLDSNQLNIVANEQLLKYPLIPKFIFFSYEERNSEKSYRDLITVAEHTDAVVMSCSGEMNAANFLRNLPHLPLKAFFLEKERKIVLRIIEIRKQSGEPFPTEMLQKIISSTAESTQGKCLGDPLNEHDNQTASSSTENTGSITGGTRHSLSCVRKIDIPIIESQEMETLADLLPICSSVRNVYISGKPSETHNAQLTVTLVSNIIFTDKLDSLALRNINLTAKPAEAIARSLQEAPSLRVLDLSRNPLGDGVSVLSRCLSCVPRLEELWLDGVKMTKEQVNDLSAAVRQSNISQLWTKYHDKKGNVKPEEEWLTDEDWRRRWWLYYGSEEEPDPGSLTDSDWKCN